jgi:SAM-dependent methyltransferase
MDTSVSVKVVHDPSTMESDSELLGLARLIEDAKALGCVAALQKHKHNVAYLTEPRRSRYLQVVNLRSDEHVLEIGASLGQHTRLIAKQCRSVEALEVVPLQAQFAKIWCDESGLENVTVTAGGASGSLPYADGAFDVVIMNYVLEWSAGRDSESAREFHMRLLREIRRVLRSDGRLFLSTKNRFGLRLVLGDRDEHMGIRFGSALPRWLSRIILGIRSPHFPKGFLHSRRGLESLLRDAGFPALRSYLAFPDARYPEALVSFDRSGLRQLRELNISALSLKSRLFLAIPFLLQRNLATSHVYIAETG